MLSFRSASMTSHCLHDDCLFLLACIYKSTEYLGQQRAQVNNSLRSAAVENCERTFATSCFPVETRAHAIRQQFREVITAGRNASERLAQRKPISDSQFSAVGFEQSKFGCAANRVSQEFRESAVFTPIDDRFAGPSSILIISTDPLNSLLPQSTLTVAMMITR